MANKVLALLMVVAVAGVALGSLWLSAPGSADASTHSATRSFSSSSVDPGGTVTVTIQADNYGGLGRIVETLPSGFTSPDASGQTVRLRLLSAGPRTATYTVTALDNPGSHSFSGTLTDEAKDTRTIGGPTTVTITAPPSTPDTDPSATRSFSATSVDPGGTVTVTIRADDYGGLGRILETLPSGFTSPDASGQTVTLRLLQEGPQTRSYTVTASDNPGSYTFSGVLESEDKSETTVGGSSTVTVNAPPPTPDTDPSATRSFSTTSVDPGGTVTVTIRADNYGGLGRVVETLPSGFTSPDASGQTVTLRLLQEGPQTRSYTVTASDNPGSHTFSGVLESEDKSQTTVGGSSSVTVRVVAPEPEPQVNRAPVFSAGNSTTRSIDENLASGANVGAVVRATDADGDTLTYSLTGTDAGSFTINSGTGQIMVGAGSTLDYETKASYMVTVTATDPAGDSDSIDVTIIVIDVVELGMVSGDPIPEYAENGMGAVATYAADGPVTAGWSVSGADMDDFAISNEGVLSFASAPDFEMPMGGADNDSNTYMVTVKAEVGGEMEMVEVTVMVTNVDEIGTLSGPETVSNYMENSEDPVGTYMVSGGSMSEMANLTLEGDDAGDFSISSAGVLSFRSSPDFENPTDADMDNTYMVTVKAEAGGEMAMQPVTVTVTNVDEDGTVMLSSMAPVVGVELTATLANSDMVTEDTVTWQWSKSMTMDGTFEDIDGATMMTYTPVAADENYYLMAKAMYTDGHGSDKMAMATSANAVSTGDPLVATYDTNPTNGMIDRPEVISAINDYLDNGVPSRADVIRLINLYLDS